jgi:hypothetical protein
MMQLGMWWGAIVALSADVKQVLIISNKYLLVDKFPVLLWATCGWLPAAVVVVVVVVVVLLDLT